MSKRTKWLCHKCGDKDKSNFYKDTPYSCKSCDDKIRQKFARENPEYMKTRLCTAFFDGIKTNVKGVRINQDAKPRI